MTTLPTICAFVLPALFSPLPQELQLGQLAPDLELTAWLAEPSAAAGGASTESSYKSSDGPGELAGRKKAAERGRVSAYHGFPLVVHTFAREDPESTGELLPLMRDLVRANLDRGIGVVGVVNESGEDALDRALPYPVAKADFAAGEGPYFDADDGAPRAFVIGPNGALLWHGDPLDEEKDFLAAVREAYARTVVEPLHGALHPELEKATAEYLAGALKSAASRADKLAKKKDEQLSTDAVALVALVEETRVAWMKDAREHGASGPDLRYFECVEAIRSALAKTDAIKELDLLEKEIKKKKYWRLRSDDLPRWIELRRERPALFPARVAKDGDRFAKDLEKFKRSTWNSNEGTQAAETLLERYVAVRGE